MKTSYKRSAVLSVLLLAVTLAVCAGHSNAVLTAAVTKTEPEGKTVAVIMYHALLKDPERQNRYVLPPSLFESDLAYLCEHGYTCVFFSDLVAYVRDGVPLPEKPVLLTFDDGYYNNYVYAYPLLERYGAKMVVSPIGIMSETYSQSGEVNPYYTHLTWDMMREMVTSGRVEIQNHSYNLHTSSYRRNGAAKNPTESDEAYQAMLRDDLTRAQALFREHGLPTPSAFVYPFGAVSAASYDVLRELGFTGSFTCEEKMNRLIPHDPESLFRLGRFRRPNHMDSKTFFETVVGLD